MENGFILDSQETQSTYLTDNTSLNLIPEANRLMRDAAAMSSILTAEDPVNTYNKIMSDFESIGKSEYVDSVVELINHDYNQGTRQAMAKILEDDTISKEDKWKAIQYYQSNRDIIPSLRDHYTEQVASLNPTAIDMPAFAQGFFSKEIAAEEIQQAINKDVSQWNPSKVSAVGGFLLEIAPFLGTYYQGARFSKMLDALDGGDRGVIEQVWNGIFQGSTVEKIRESIASLPTDAQKIEATKKLLNIIKEFPGTDYNRWSAINRAIEGDYANWEKYLDNTLGIVGAVFGGVVVAKGVAKTGLANITKTIDPSSPLGIAARHNPQYAGKLTGKAILDEEGNVAQALGEQHATIISSMMTKTSDEVVDAINGNEAGIEVMKAIDQLDAKALEALESTERAGVLYTNELKDEVSVLMQDTITKTQAASVHLGKSTMNLTDLGIEGKAVFGKTSETAFSSYSEAKEAALKLQDQLPEGYLEIVKPGRGGSLRPGYATTDKGDHFIRYHYKKNIDPQDIVIYGPDAIGVNATLLGKSLPNVSKILTSIARTKLGGYLFAHQMLPKAATDAAFASYHKAFAVEKTFLDSIHNNISNLSSDNRKAVAQLLDEGENFTEGGVIVGKVFSYDEVIKKSLARGLSQSDAEKVAVGYYTYRRVADWMYTALDRTKSKQFREGGFKWYHRDGSRFLARPQVLDNDTRKVRSVYDPVTGTVEHINEAELEHLYKNGGSLVRLGRSYRNGDEIVEYGRVGATTETSDVLQGAVPYIKGYVPRMYDNYYFVTRTPTKVNVNGQSLTGEHTAYSTNVFASDSHADALAKMKALQEADPDAKFAIKKDRLNENTLLEDQDLMRKAKVHSSRRGDTALEGGRTVDPLVALQKTVTSLSQRTAMDDFMTASRGDFVRQYNKFLVDKGQFPTSKNGIQATKNMSMEDAKQLANAHTVYNWLEGMTLMTRYDTAIWKEVMYAAGEFAEKFSPTLTKLFQAIGKNYPVDMLRKASTALFISLRPARQLLLQPSQLLTLGAIDSSLLNPIKSIKFYKDIASIQVASSYKTGNAMNKSLDDDMIIQIGSKMMGIPAKDYETIINHLRKSGLLAAVDTHTIVDGMYLNQGKQLVESGAERAGRVIKGVASAPAKIGRTVGFDAGERFNVIGSWLTARNRFMRMNPTVDVNSKQALEQITADAHEIAWSMSRPGTFQYQKNAFSLPLQFVAAPHKALLGLTTSKFWTPAEKARLAVGHFVLYGSAGLGLVTLTQKFREEYGSQVDRQTWQLIEGGVLDWGVNGLINSLLHDGKDETQLDLSRTYSPLNNGPFPFSEFLVGLTEEPAATVLLGPSWNLVDPQKGRLVTAVRDIAGVFQTEQLDTDEKLKIATLRATELASGGTDYMKFRLAWNLGLNVAANGHTITGEATQAEAVAKLFGIGTTKERVIREMNQKMFDDAQETKNTAKFMYDEMVRASRTYGDDRESWQVMNDKLRAFLSIETDESKRKAIAKHIRELTKQANKSGEDSWNFRIYKDAQYRSAEQNQALYNTLKSYGYDDSANRIKSLIGEEE